MFGSGIAAKSIHGAKVCVIPYPENNYRPLALRRGPLALASALIIAAKTLALTAVALMPLSAELSTITNARIVQLTNAERTKAGLNALNENPMLSAAAAAKAEDLINNDYFAHISPTGVTPWFWMHQAGYTYRVAGENLAIDFTEAEDVVAAWMASPSHKENIIHGDYTETGVAVLTGEYQGGTSTVVVHMFGKGLHATAGTIQQSPATPPPPEEETVAPSPAPTSPPPVATSLPVPPRMPSIALAGETEVRDELALLINGEAGAEIKISVNGAVKLRIVPGTPDTLTRKISLQGVPDGVLSISAWAERDGLTSGESQIITVVKDTVGPDLEKTDVTYVISPAIDQPGVLAVLPGGNWQSVRINGQVFGSEARFAWIEGVPGDLSIVFSDAAGNEAVLDGITLQPQFFIERDPSYLQPSNNMMQRARQLALIIFVIVTILLILAIIIRIRIQHPKLIAEACIVLALAMLGILL